MNLLNLARKCSGLIAALCMSVTLVAADTMPAADLVEEASDITEANDLVTIEDAPARDAKSSPLVMTNDEGKSVDQPVAIDEARPHTLRSEHRFAAAEQVRVDLAIKPIDRVSAQITPSKGKLPENLAAKDFAAQPEVWQSDDRQWAAKPPLCWEASNFGHQPLYFEEINLERYGYDRGCLQPIFSAANFYGSVALLPYKVVCYPWCDCYYTLGHYRPGSCAPYCCYRLPLRLDAALAEAGAWTGFAFLLP